MEISVEQKVYNLTPYQKAAKNQTAYIGDISHELMTRIVSLAIVAEPSTTIGNVCGMTKIVYQELTSLKLALEKNNLPIIMRIFSVISATDPENANKRILNIVDKISAQLAQQEKPDLIFLQKVLELPQCFGKKIVFEKEKKFILTEDKDFANWTIQNDLEELIKLLIKSGNLTNFHAYQLAEHCIDKGNNTIFEALLDHNQVPCDFNYDEALKKICFHNYFKILKLIQLYRLFPLNENNQYQNVMQIAVRAGHVEIIKILEENSIGNLNDAIISEIDKFVNISEEFLDMIVNRKTKEDVPIVTNLELYKIMKDLLLNRSHNKTNKAEAAIFAYKILLERNAHSFMRDAILLTVKKGHHNILNVFLNMTDINLTTLTGNWNGYLKNAVIKGHLEVLKILLPREDIEVSQNIIEFGIVYGNKEIRELFKFHAQLSEIQDNLLTHIFYPIFKVINQAFRNLAHSSMPLSHPQRVIWLNNGEAPYQNNYTLPRAY